MSKTNAIDPSIAQIDAYFDEMDTLIRQHSRPYVFVSYSEDSVYISSEARIHIGKRASLITEKYKDRNKGSIIVSNGMIAQNDVESHSAGIQTLKRLYHSVQFGCCHGQSQRDTKYIALHTVV